MSTSLTFNASKILQSFVIYAFITAAIISTAWGNECLKGNCQDGYGMLVKDDGTLYEGFFENGEKHLFGAYYWPSGGWYFGNFHHGKRSFFGSQWSSNGIKVFSNWNHETGKRLEGIGIYTVLSGAVTSEGKIAHDWGVGCYLGDCLNGYGVQAKKGHLYAGFFENGRFQYWGAATEVYRWGDEGLLSQLSVGVYKNGSIKDGRLYSSNYNNNVGSSVGMPTLDKGSWLQNRIWWPFKNDSCVAGNCETGMGVKQYDDGIYAGFFLGGNRHLFGHFFEENGNHFVGAFVNDKRLSCGVYMIPEGLTGRQINQDATCNDIVRDAMRRSKSESAPRVTNVANDLSTNVNDTSVKAADTSGVNNSQSTMDVYSAKIVTRRQTDGQKIQNYTTADLCSFEMRHHPMMPGDNNYCSIMEEIQVYHIEGTCSFYDDKVTRVSTSRTAALFKFEVTGAESKWQELLKKHPNQYTINPNGAIDTMIAHYAQFPSARTVENAKWGTQRTIAKNWISLERMRAALTKIGCFADNVYEN